MSLESRRILIADTDEALVLELKAAVETKGYTAVTTNNGLQGSTLVDTENFAAIITNVKLHSMSGMQIAAAARGGRMNGRVPIVLLTEVPDAEVSRRATQLGTVYVLQKPVSAEKVLQKLWGGPESAPRQSATDAYDARIMNTFMESLQDVFVFYFGKRAQLGTAAVKGETNTFGFLSALISYTGESVRGSMAMSFEHDFLMALAKRVFSGNPIEMTEALLADMAGEMANQVCGTVKLKFGKLGLKVMIGLPKVVIGKDHKIIHLVKNPVIWVPVQIDGASCAIEFCMDKSDELIGDDDGEGDGSVAGGDVLLF